MPGSSPPPRRSDNVRLGVTTIVGTVFALSLGDAIVKSHASGETLGLWQLFAVRSILAIPVLLIGARMVAPLTRIMPRNIGWVLARSALLGAMWIFYYAALPHLPFADAAAAYYTSPLFIVALSALIGGERVGPMQWAGVVTGFVGILLILRPGTEAFQEAALLPLMSALLYASAMVLTRRKCLDEHPVTLAVGLNAVFVVIGVAGLAYGVIAPETFAGFFTTAWAPMGPAEWAVMAVLTASVLIASVGAAVAYQAAPASTVGTFDFSYVGFALLWGIVLFDERPDLVAITGIALIVLAGTLAVRRQPSPS